MESSAGPARCPDNHDLRMPASLPSRGDLVDLVDKLPAFIAYYGTDWCYRFVNARYEAWFRRPREWFIGRSLAEVNGSEVFALIEPYIRRAMAGQEVWFDFERRAPGGTELRSLHVHLVPDQRPGEDVAGVFAMFEDVTERYAAERAASQAQWEKQVIADRLPALVAYVDPRMRYRYVNRRFEDWYQRPAAWFIGRSVAEVVGADTFAVTGPLLQRAARGETLEFEYPRRNELLHPPDRVLRVQLVPDRSGGLPRGFVALMEDVTDKLAAQQALRESETRLRQITETIDDVFWLIEVGKPQSMYVSPGFSAIYGRECSAVGGTPAEWVKWVHAEDRARMAHRFAGLAAGIGYAEEYRIERPDGSVRWIHEKAHRVPVEAAEVILIAGLASDVTARKTAALALERSEAMLRQITEHTRDVFWLLDAASGELVYVGPGYLRVWGQPVVLSLDPLPWFDRLHADDRDMVAAARRLLRESGCCDVHYRIIRPDGELRWVHTQAFPIRDGRGQLERIAGFAEDVTDSRRVAEMKRLKEEAESANRTKSDFLSRMSHELRTPLNAVLGFAQILLFDDMTRLAPTQRDSVNEIIAAGRHLLAIVDEMLDLTRIEMGKLRIELDALVVSEVVRECVSMVQAQAEESCVVVASHVPAGAVQQTVMADRTRVRQILLNLLSNAIKYNNVGGQVEIAVDQPTPGRIRVSVRDTGPGLSSAQIEQLFIPFQRLDAERIRCEGLGLGLALSKQLAEAMGGTIGATSEPGAGCTFWLELGAV